MNEDTLLKALEGFIEASQRDPDSASPWAYYEGLEPFILGNLSRVAVYSGAIGIDFVATFETADGPRRVNCPARLRNAIVNGIRSRDEAWTVPAVGESDHELTPLCFLVVYKGQDEPGKSAHKFEVQYSDRMTQEALEFNQDRVEIWHPTPADSDLG